MSRMTSAGRNPPSKFASTLALATLALIAVFFVQSANQIWQQESLSLVIKRLIVPNGIQAPADQPQVITDKDLPASAVGNASAHQR